MNFPVFNQYINTLQSKSPYAAAIVRGSAKYPSIAGIVTFSRLEQGTLVNAQFHGLPQNAAVRCEQSFLAMHIHSGASCSGTSEMPFANADGHYNPRSCPHPAHAGDLPPLINAGGFAWCAFLTAGFTAEEIVGKTVILHRDRDDFTTQPSGAAGEMIACGEIVRLGK